MEAFKIFWWIILGSKTRTGIFFVEVQWLDKKLCLVWFPWTHLYLSLVWKNDEQNFSGNLDILLEIRMHTIPQGIGQDTGEIRGMSPTKLSWPLKWYIQSIQSNDCFRILVPKPSLCNGDTTLLYRIPSLTPIPCILQVLAIYCETLSTSLTNRIYITLKKSVNELDQIMGCLGSYPELALFILETTSEMENKLIRENRLIQ